MSRKRRDDAASTAVQWHRGRVAAIVFCFLLASIVFYVAYELETDPTAEARFAQYTEDRTLTRADVSWLKVVAAGLGAAAVLILFARPR